LGAPLYFYLQRRADHVVCVELQPLWPFATYADQYMGVGVVSGDIFFQFIDVVGLHTSMQGVEQA
jgi:hypothetical protein